jgi:uncharacterized membrane protein
MGENKFAAIPEAFYGIVLLMASVAYYILQVQIKRKEENVILQKAVGKDKKAIISPVLYAVAIGSTFINQWIAGVIYCVVALMWIIPDPRIEKTIEKEPD